MESKTLLQDGVDRWRRHFVYSLRNCESIINEYRWFQAL